MSSFRFAAAFLAFFSWGFAGAYADSEVVNLKPAANNPKADLIIGVPILSINPGAVNRGDMYWLVVSTSVVIESITINGGQCFAVAQVNIPSLLLEGNSYGFYASKQKPSREPDNSDNPGFLLSDDECNSDVKKIEITTQDYDGHVAVSTFVLAP